jgi:hypothetical protein
MKHTPFYYHLMDRGWRGWLNSWVDWETETVTFPLYSHNTQPHLARSMDCPKWIGYQRYRWNQPKVRGNSSREQRYYTYVQEEHKGMAVYGWDNCFGHGPLFITEGIFDALKVTNCWWDCIALTTNQPTKQAKQWLNDITYGRKVIALLDRGEPYIRWMRIASECWYPPEPYGDIGDMPLDEVSEFILENLQ